MRSSDSFYISRYHRNCFIDPSIYIIIVQKGEALWKFFEVEILMKPSNGIRRAGYLLVRDTVYKKKKKKKRIEKKRKEKKMKNLYAPTILMEERYRKYSQTVSIDVRSVRRCTKH